MYNLVLTSSEYPTAWSEAYITPIHKTGSPLKAENYRGIAIMSTTAKIFNSILNTRLVKYISENNTLHYSQIGFVKKCRTTDHIFVIKTLLDKYLKQKKKLYICFVDMQKAFDTIWHTGLLYKLQLNGISGLFYNIIKNMYKHVKLSVRNGYELSPPFASEKGIRQGDILSPYLFNLYMNDLPKIFDENCKPPTLMTRKIPCLLYADDLVILSESKEGLQESLNKLERFCKEWFLTVNTSKSKIIIYQDKKRNKDTFIYNNTEIECVKTYTYLGVNISSDGKFIDAKTRLYKKGLKAYFKLQQTLANTTTSIKTQMHIFDHTIKPILLYGSEIWGSFSLTKKLKQQGFESLTEIYLKERNDFFPQENICMKFYKYALGVSKQSTNIAVRGELGRYPLYIETILQMIKYYIRTLSMPENCLVKEAMQCSKELSDKYNVESWYDNFECILKHIGQRKPDATTSKNKYIRAAHKLLHHDFDRFWASKLQHDTRKNPKEKSKLRTYRIFKNIFKEEPYLTSVKNKEFRVALTQLRISAHRLAIETGRYAKLDVNQRICVVCDDNKIEDEIHFLMECSGLSSIRNPVMNDITTRYKNFKTLSIENKFAWLLSNEEPWVCKAIASLTKQMFEKRKLSI